jgi:SagB-type dehydrogenase family enzyme
MARRTSDAAALSTVSYEAGEHVALPAPSLTGGGSLNRMLAARRSTRDYSHAPITREQVGQLLWAAQGVTGTGGLRTAPSAATMFPLRTYFVSACVRGLPAGVSEYEPDLHSLHWKLSGEVRPQLYEAACEQICVAECAGAILLAAQYRRIIAEFGERGILLTHIEAGHVAQNVLLQATALGLGAVGLGKFDPEQVRQCLHLRSSEHPLYLITFGRPIG